MAWESSPGGPTRDRTLALGSALVLALASIVGAGASCLPNFNDFHVGGNDAGGDGDGDGDGDVDGDGDGDGDGGPCERPYLMIVVQGRDEDGGDSRVIRFRLSESGVANRCGDLTAQGVLPGPLTTAAWVGDDRIALGGRQGVLVIEAQADVPHWPTPAPPPDEGMLPIDIAAREEPAETRVLVTGWASSEGESITRLDARAVEDGASGDSWSWTVATSLSELGDSLGGIAAAPWSKETLLALSAAGLYTAREFDPFDGRVWEDEYLRWLGGESTPTTIASLRFPATSGGEDTYRTVFAAGREGVLYCNDTGMGCGSPSGPRGCSNIEGCTFLHAVPDPAHVQGVYGICERSGRRRVVRFTTITAECEVVLTDDEAGGRLVRLAVAPVPDS